MSAARLVAGLLTVAAIVGPTAIAGWRVQSVLDRRTRAQHILGGATVAIALVVIVSELLGAVGLFRPAPLLVGMWLASLSVVAVSRRLAPRKSTSSVEGPDGATHPFPRWVPRFTALATAAIAVSWTTVVVRTVSTGLVEADSRHYHLPFAAEFVKTGWTTRLHPIWPDPVQLFHPASSELVQAIAMLTMDRDVLAPFANLGWLALFLLAGWCVGVSDRVAPVTLLGVTWLAGLPLLVHTNGGSAVNDIAALSLLATAVALWRTAAGDRQWQMVAALALGLAIGTKLSVAAAAGSLVVAAVVFSRRRLAVLGIIAAPIVLGGSFWYVRNLFRTGSPLPSVGLPLFPSPDLPLIDRFGFSVADNLSSGDAWRTAFRPAIRDVFGVAGLVAGLGVLAVVPVLVRARNRFASAVAVCGVVALLAYLVTPVSAWGFQDHPDPGLFLANLRYTFPGLLLVVLAATLASAHTTSRQQAWLSVGLFGAVVLNLFGKRNLTDQRFRDIAVAIGALAGVAAVVVATSRITTITNIPKQWAAIGLAVVILIGVAAVGPSVTRHQIKKGLVASDPSVARLYEWAVSVAPARIGYYALNPQYPMYGPGWDNELEYIGVAGDHGAFRAVRTCEEYVTVLDQQRFDYVVLGPSSTFLDTIDLAGWTATQPGATKLFDAPPFVAFKVAAPFAAERCRARS